MYPSIHPWTRPQVISSREPKDASALGLLPTPTPTECRPAKRSELHGTPSSTLRNGHLQRPCAPALDADASTARRARSRSLPLEHQHKDARFRTRKRLGESINAHCPRELQELASSTAQWAKKVSFLKEPSLLHMAGQMCHLSLDSSPSPCRPRPFLLSCRDPSFRVPHRHLLTEASPQLRTVQLPLQKASPRRLFQETQFLPLTSLCEYPRCIVFSSAHPLPTMKTTEATDNRHRRPLRVRQGLDKLVPRDCQKTDSQARRRLHLLDQKT